MEKIRKKIRGVESWTRGHIIENMAIADDVLRGYEIRPTGKGSDYMRRRVNPITGWKGRWEKVDVKGPRSKLTERQRREARKTLSRGGKYVVKQAIDPYGFLGFREKVPRLRRKRKRRRRK